MINTAGGEEENSKARGRGFFLIGSMLPDCTYRGICCKINLRLDVFHGDPSVVPNFAETVEIAKNSAQMVPNSAQYLYWIYWIYIRYKTTYAVFQKLHKSRFSNGFVDNSIIFVIKTN